MTLPAIVRRAIFDRQPPYRRHAAKSGTATTSVVVRLLVEPRRIRAIGGFSGRERQINLTDGELSCLQPIQTTLFGNRDARRSVRLIVNRRRSYLLSVSNTGILVFTYSKF